MKTKVGKLIKKIAPVLEAMFKANAFDKIFMRDFPEDFFDLVDLDDVQAPLLVLACWAKMKDLLPSEDEYLEAVQTMRIAVGIESVAYRCDLPLRLEDGLSPLQLELRRWTKLVSENMKKV